MICERQKIMNWIKHNQNNDKTSYEQQQEHYVTQDLATSLLEKTVTGHHNTQTLKSYWPFTTQLIIAELKHKPKLKQNQFMFQTASPDLSNEQKIFSIKWSKN